MSYVNWIRSLVGQRKIFIPYASVILCDHQQRVLLQRRTDLDIWGLPGGVLKIGEDILTCARRELIEETGLRAGELKLVGVYSEPAYDVTYPNGDQVQQYSLCFAGYFAGGTLRPDGIETDEAAFFMHEEIPENQISPWYTAMLGDFMAGNMPAFQKPYTSDSTVDQIQDIRPLIGKAVYHGVGSAAVVVNPTGHVLMAQRTDNGYWHFPGGYMHLGENAAHTVIREIKEETDLEIIPERIIGVMSPKDPWVYPNGDQVQGVVTFFLARLVDEASDNFIQVDQTETVQAQWVPPEQVMNLTTHPRMAVVHRAILEHLDAGYFIV